jgi:hypothetical protein
MLAIAIPRFAYGIDVQCGGEVYRYTTIFGYSPSIEIREDGIWEEYCKPQNGERIDCTKNSGLKDCAKGPVRKSFGDNSVKCEIDFWSHTSSKGELWVVKNEVHVLDFKLLTHTTRADVRVGKSEWIDYKYSKTCNPLN